MQQQPTGCLYSAESGRQKKNEAWLEAEEVELSGDKLEEPAAIEDVGSSEIESCFDLGHFATMSSIL